MVSKKATAKKPARRKLGRPEVYTTELGKAICRAIATGNRGLKTLCSNNKGFPSYQTVFNWLADPEKYGEFVDLYARAKEEQADFLADEMLDIADNPVQGSRTVHKTGGKHGLEISKTIDGDMVERSRLMIDTRKFLASKLKPKKYGNKLDLTSGDKPIKQIDLGAMISKFMGENEGNTEATSGT